MQLSLPDEAVCLLDAEDRPLKPWLRRVSATRNSITPSAASLISGHDVAE